MVVLFSNRHSFRIDIGHHKVVNWQGPSYLSIFDRDATSHIQTQGLFESIIHNHACVIFGDWFQLTDINQPPVKDIKFSNNFWI